MILNTVSEAVELGLIDLQTVNNTEESSPVDASFEEEFAQENVRWSSWGSCCGRSCWSCRRTRNEEEVVEVEEELLKSKKVIEYEDFEDLDDEYSKYDEEIDYDEYDEYYDKD